VSRSAEPTPVVKRCEVDQCQPGVVCQDRCGKAGDDLGPRQVHYLHQTARVAAVYQYAQPPTEHQPRQALHGGDGRYRSSRPRELHRQQGECG
jgi:hypothetical protein